MAEYESLATRRKKQRIIYSGRLSPKENIQWKGWRCREHPSVKTIPVIGTGFCLNHWVVYLHHNHEPVLTISTHFVESDAVNVAAATEAAIKGLASRGWRPNDYLRGDSISQLSKLITLVMEDESPPEEFLWLFANFKLLKAIKKILKVNGRN